MFDLVFDVAQWFSIVSLIVRVVIEKNGKEIILRFIKCQVKYTSDFSRSIISDLVFDVV